MTANQDERQRRLGALRRLRTWLRRQRPVAGVVWVLLGWGASKAVLVESLWLHQVVTYVLLLAAAAVIVRQIVWPIRRSRVGGIGDPAC